MTDISTATPLMRQYFQIKENYPDALVFFQVGDFFECFFQDAKTASQVLSITLTKRGKHQGQDIPLCGVPSHMVNVHATRLVKAGHKVAICAQTEPAKAGSIVNRAVTELLTPGTLVDEVMLVPKKPSYICSIAQGQGALGILFCELLTLQLFATRIVGQEIRVLEGELSRFFPDEVLFEEALSEKIVNTIRGRGFFVSPLAKTRQLNEIPFAQNVSEQLKKYPEFSRSAELLGTYLCRHNESSIVKISDLTIYDWQDFLVLDAATVHNLEIVRNNSGTTSDTLLSCVDSCRTAMGSRMLCKWLLRPLIDHKAIVTRQEKVGVLQSSSTRLMSLSGVLSQIPDVERIVGRVALDRAKVPDYFSLSDALECFKRLTELLSGLAEFQSNLSDLAGFSDLSELLFRALDRELSLDLPIRVGFDSELDRLRQIDRDAQKMILAFEESEIKKTGIDGLKIRYSDAWGYAIELTKIQSVRVPENYKLEQTLVGKNRYTTEELKNLEAEITRARAQISAREALVWAEIKAQVSLHVQRLQRAASTVASLDGLFGLAWTAWQNNWTRPVLLENSDGQILIEDGRHPVVEKKLSGHFVPNSVNLNRDQSIWLVTGPNMGGKSTFLRQVAQICLLAHAGSFVPAKRAEISILDRIFTRIGAGDNLAAGKSTFLVEMEEAATICRDATKNSLVIMDEVGRGTSASEGLALARALVNFIRFDLQAFCLFATHYHELSELEKSGIITNHCVRAKAQGDGLLFLHKVVAGAALSSFGIEVARIAGLPKKVIDMARKFDQENSQSGQGSQKSVFQPSKLIRDPEMEAKVEVLKVLSEVKTDDLSPRQAHELLSELVTKIKSF